MAVNAKPRFRNWQKYLENKVALLRDSGAIAEFEDITTVSEKMKFIERVTTPEPVWIAEYFRMCREWHTSKSDAEAELFRSAGNKHFERKDYNKALNSYNQCVKHAVHPSEASIISDQLALGYANRSAVLLRLGDIQCCLHDIDLALENGYPQRLVYKLYQRRALCLQKLGQVKEAFTAIEKAKAALADADISKDKQDKCLADLVKIHSQLENMEVPSRSDPGVTSSNLPTPVHGFNDVITQASRDVRLAWNEKQGRYIVARSPIEAGSVLMVERPFAAVLLPPQYNTHCHHCYHKLLSIVPCQHCTEVGYCSKKCQSESWLTYHRTECRYLDLLHSIGVAHLSLRIILTAGLDDLLDFQSTYQPTDPPGLTTSGKYERNYLAVYELMPHLKDMQTEDLLQYAMTAGLLLRLLSESGFFTVRCDDKSTSAEEKEYIGGLLLRHICQLVCNAHAITELQVDTKDSSSLVHSQHQERVATAIYPTASLMNHSCDPTVISSFHQDVLVVRAIKDVMPDEEILNCYGPHYCKMAYRERQQQLQDQYFFCCQCTACLQQGTEEKKLQAFRCSACEGPVVIESSSTGLCLHCNCVMDVGEEVKMFEISQDLFRKGLQTLETGNINGATEHLLACHSIRKRVLYKHNKDLAEIQDLLAKCFAIKGDYERSCTYLAPSISTTQEIYGKKSIELANELHKYAEILVNAKKFSEALLVAERARDIMKLNYGESHDIVLEINDLIENIRSVEINAKAEQ